MTNIDMETYVVREFIGSKLRYGPNSPLQAQTMYVQCEFLFGTSEANEYG